MNYELARESRQQKYIETVRLKEGNPDFMASPAGYHSIHQWLKRNFGSPRHCEHCGDPGYKEAGGRWSIHYALKRGMNHAHMQENYLALCRHCHGVYDWSESKTQNMIEAARKQKGTRSKTKSLIANARPRDEYGHFTTKTT